LVGLFVYFWIAFFVYMHMSPGEICIVIALLF
jgi:hypothetical protein